MKINVQHITFSLFMATVIAACSGSSDSNLQRPARNIHTDFIANIKRTDVDKKASVEEIMVQFHGCKAHQ